MHSESSQPESQMDTWTPPLSSLTCVSSYSPVQPTNTAELRTWLAAVSPANPFPSQANGRAQTTSATSGRKPSSASGAYGQRSLFSKTSPDSSVPGTSELFFVTFLRAGMTVAGELYRQPMWERRTSVIGSGLLPTPTTNDAALERRGGDLYMTANGTVRARLPDGRTSNRGLGATVQAWPTPTVNGNNNRAGASPTSGDGLSTAVKRWPTPRVSDANGPQIQPGKQGGLGLNRVVGGALNPDWVDLLMGWPRGWTSLDPLPAASWARWLAGDWWGDGWEAGVPRLTDSRRNRVARLCLLGNGQVPQTAAAAWQILVGGAE